jgi:hypothetical protein
LLRHFRVDGGSTGVRHRMAWPGGGTIGVRHFRVGDDSTGVRHRMA